MSNLSHPYSLNENMNNKEWYFLINKIKWDYMRVNDVYHTWMQLSNILEHTNKSKWYLKYTNESKQYCDMNIFIIIDILRKIDHEMTEKWPRNDWKMTKHIWELNIKYHSWLISHNLVFHSSSVIERNFWKQFW